jgi:hypothetical protein
LTSKFWDMIHSKGTRGAAPVARRPEFSGCES